MLKEEAIALLEGLGLNDQYLVIIDSLNASEASAFIKFLESEILRHKMDIKQAQELIYTVLHKFEELA